MSFGGEITRASKLAMLRTLKADLLYLFLGVAFLVWRLFFFQSTRRATNLGVLLGKYGALPVHSVISVIIETLKDILETTVFAWVVPFYQFVATSNYRDLAIAAGIALLVVACIFWFSGWLIRQTSASGQRPAFQSGPSSDLAGSYSSSSLP